MRRRIIRTSLEWLNAHYTLQLKKMETMALRYCSVWNKPKLVTSWLGTSVKLLPFVFICFHQKSRQIYTWIRIFDVHLQSAFTNFEPPAEQLTPRRARMVVINKLTPEHSFLHEERWNLNQVSQTEPREKTKDNKKKKAGWQNLASKIKTSQVRQRGRR